MPKADEAVIHARLVPFEEAARLRKVGSHEYACNIHPQWSLGPAAHGGFLIALIWRAVGVYFGKDGHLARYNQPRTIAFHIEFLRPAAVGEARIIIRDVRLGKGTSTVHASLVQEGRESCVVYATNAGPASAVNAVSIAMSSPPRPPPIDFDAVLRRSDKNWICHDVVFEDPKVPVAAISKFIFAMRRNPTFAQNVTQYWITPRLTFQYWTTNMLGLLFDLSLPGAESFCPGTEHGYHKTVARALRNEREGKSSCNHPPWEGPRYYPTVNMSVEVKRQLPKEGVKWLFLQCEAREVVEGRWDWDAACLDEKGRLIAIARSLSLVVEYGRSTVARTSKEAKSKECKI